MTSRTTKLLIAATLMVVAVASAASAASFGEPIADGYTYMSGYGFNGTNTYLSAYGLADGITYDGVSYLKWDVSSVAPGTYAVSSASITITHFANPLWTIAQSAQYPLQFVDVGSSWGETTPVGSLPAPGSTVYGSGSYSGAIPTGQAFTWTINLDPVAFTSYFNSAVSAGELNLVARSLVPMESMQNQVRYKWYSNQDATYSGSILNVDYTAVPEPGSMIAMLAGLTGMVGVIRRKTS